MDEDELKNLAEQKEKEWRSIQEKRIELLEKSLKEKSHDLTEEKSKFAQLKEDFKYNLKLLEERDADLEKYEQTIIATRKQLSEKNSEISELKIKIDELKKIQSNEKNSLDESKKYYLNRLTQKQNEVDKYKSAKDAEVNQERHEIEKYKRTLKREVQDLQIDLETQRHELKTEFDNILRKREHEWRLKTDEFNTQELAKELQIKMLTNELNQLKETTSCLKTNNNDTETNLKSLERKLKEKEWELKDTIVLKDARINEIEIKLSQLQANANNANEDLNRKNEEMDRTIREKVMCVEKLKLTIADLEKNTAFLEEQIIEYKIQIKHLTLNSKEGGKEKEKEILALNEEIFKLKLDLNKEVETKAKHNIKYDLTVEDLKQTSEEANKNMVKLKTEIEQLKCKAAEDLSKLNQLEHEKCQLNLDWQQKYQYLERVKAKDSQDFNMQILESRDQVNFKAQVCLALAQIKTLEDKLRHKENVIKAQQTADPSLNLLDLESNKEFQLKEENEKLKQIVKMMREEMENLATDPNEFIPTKENLIGKSPQPDISPIAITSNSEFEKDLTAQLQEAKQKNRQLQSQLDEYILALKVPENITDNTIINSHIKTLNETISILRKEKMDLTTFCKKQQTKLQHIEKSSGDQSEQMRLRQTQIETLQYEMSSQTRRTTTEISNLKQTLANLELELSATRREADEYHKATIEKGSEVSALESKISELKLKLSTSGTQLNFGAQELFIQQLQDEIKRLGKMNSQLQIKTRQTHHQAMRQQQHSTMNEFYTEFNESAIGPSINDLARIKEIESLKSKLKSAAKYISHLIQEKEHLIEMSNQLRGELNKIKYDNDNLSLMRINRDVTDQLMQSQTNSKCNKSISPAYKDSLQTKLQQLEKKQYELTKQQLSFAQKKAMTKSDSMLNKDYTSSNYKDSETLTSTDDTNTVYSSVKSENLKDIWKIIDEHQDNPMLMSTEEPILQVTGSKPKISNVTFSKSPRKKSAATPKLETKIQKSKIRNYNDRN